MGLAALNVERVSNLLERVLPELFINFSSILKTLSPLEE